ncbi:MAG: PadR family transcriptional regulator [Spirochaetia bacterium]|nr:PadR family transcriptional regulator [Spirochaetia bacterium]
MKEVANVNIRYTKSTIDLTILGILSIKSMSAYELANFIENRRVKRMLKISTPAIYKVCKKLFNNGLLDGETVKEGENPEKVIYSLNKKGKERFIGLMEHFSSNIDPFYFDFNAFIWNIEHVEPEKAVKMLKNLQQRLIYFRNGVNMHEKEISGAPFSARMIVRQYCLIAESLTKWIEYTIQEFEKKNR